VLLPYETKVTGNKTKKLVEVYEKEIKTWMNGSPLKRNFLAKIVDLKNKRNLSKINIEEFFCKKHIYYFMSHIAQQTCDLP